MQQTKVSIGIGGWEHDVLNSCLYPPGLTGSAELLRMYAELFDTVEIRSTFWDDSLERCDAQRWADAVSGNRRFLFQVKLHSSFTHKKTTPSQCSRNTRALAHELLKRNRLGGLLAQLPYSFTNTGTHRFHLA
jgi:uncharacterized protein YecE (DUF72 family)